MKKANKLIAVCSVLTLWSVTSFAQTTLTIENGTSESSTTQASPVNNNYETYRMQIVYTADELYELGWTAGEPGTISQLGFYATQAPNNALPNWTIKLKNTTAIDASSHDGTGLTTCFTNSSYSPTIDSYEMHTFTTNFDWDGVSNLLVDICWDVASGYSSTGKVRAYNYTNGMRYVRAISSSQCDQSTTSQSSYKPSVKLVVTANTNVPSNDAICSASSLTVDADCTPSTNLYATTVSGDETGSCWSVSSKSHTVWCSFTAPSDGKADIYVEAYGYHTLTNSQVAIFSSSDGSCSGTLTEVGCDDDSSTPGCSNCAYEQLTGLTSGDTYFIEVDGSSSDAGSFCISVRSAAITFTNTSGDSLWTTASNWSSGVVPTSTTNVEFTTGVPYIPTKTTAECNNLTIASGAKLRIESGTKTGDAVTYKVYGDVINNGTIEHNGNYYMYLYGDDQRVGGSGTYTTTSGTGPGYSFVSGSKITLSSNLSSFKFINIDGVVELGSKTLQTTNFTLASGATLKQNTGTLEIQETTPTFSGNFLPQQGTTYYNVTSGDYDVDDAATYNHLKLKHSGSNTVRIRTLTCQNLTITPDGSPTGIVRNWAGEYATVNGDLTIDASAELQGSSSGAGGIKLSGNWTNNGTFDTPGTSIITFQGSTNQTISGTNSPTFYDLTINNTNATGVSLSKSATVNNILTLTDGVINTSSTNILTLGTDATVSGTDGSAASHISGPMDKNTNTAVLFKFPLGEEGVYKPIGVTPSTGDALTFRAQAWNDSPGETAGYNPSTIASGQLNNVSTIEYWDVDETTGSFDPVTATIRLYWDTNSEVDDESSSDLRVAHWDGSQWEDIGQSAISSANDWVEASATSFSPFTIGSDGSSNNPLPVELISFDAKVINKGVELTWVTATEIDNAYFEVQRSVNGVHFEKIATVQGAGNSIAIINYTIMDENPVVGNSYYRLKQVDYDGTSDFSKVISVHYRSERKFELISISPSPASSFTQLTLNVAEPDEMFINIYDTKGDLLKKDKVVVLEGYNEIRLDISGLPTGVYLITVQNSKAFVSTRIIKSENILY